MPLLPVRIAAGQVHGALAGARFTFSDLVPGHEQALDGEPSGSVPGVVERRLLRIRDVPLQLTLRQRRTNLSEQRGSLLAGQFGQEVQQIAQGGSPILAADRC